MSETKNPGDKKAGSKTLTLKRGVEQGTVRQSFSHGRSKQVVVEKVKRRVIGAAADAKVEAAPAPEVVAPKRAAKTAEP
ncbi:MAG: translation initiation factor IF-2 associated domain-containing protein, partial [Pseudorhodoplanes sp.]